MQSSMQNGKFWQICPAGACISLHYGYNPSHTKKHITSAVKRHSILILNRKNIRNREMQNTPCKMHALFSGGSALYKGTAGQRYFTT